MTYGCKGKQKLSTLQYKVLSFCQELCIFNKKTIKRKRKYTFNLSSGSIASVDYWACAGGYMSLRQGLRLRKSKVTRYVGRR